jgi:hypothetical protein
VQRAAAFERPARDGDVGRRLEGESGKMRMASHDDHLEGGERELEARLLRHDCDAPRDLLARERPEVVADDADLTGKPPEDAREGAHQGALAGAVRPQQADDTSRLQVEIDPGEHVARGVGDRQIAHLEQRWSWRTFRHRGHRSRRRRPSSSLRGGAAEAGRTARREAP